MVKCNDYTITRRVAGKVVSRFSDMLREIEDDYEEEIVVCTLLSYYAYRSRPEKIDNSSDVIPPDEDLLWAIDRVLQDFMVSSDYNSWVLARAYPK